MSRATDPINHVNSFFHSFGQILAQIPKSIKIPLMFVMLPSKEMAGRLFPFFRGPLPGGPAGPDHPGDPEPLADSYFPMGWLFGFKLRMCIPIRENMEIYMNFNKINECIKKTYQHI